MDIKDLKIQVPLLTVLEDFGVEFRGGGNRLRAKINPIREGGDFDLYQDTQKYFDHGTGEGGDVVDFIEATENLNKSEAITFLQEKYLNGVEMHSNYVRPAPKIKPIKDNEKLMSILKTKAQKYLTEPRVHNDRPRERFKYFELEDVAPKEVAALDEVFIKLFEHSYLETDGDRIEYIFNKYVGYDSYFDCPAIILYDLHGNVVNIVKYRPKKAGKEFMKYLYLKAEETPESSYLYPFQYEMERMILKHGFAYVGEGLKNALVALTFGLPYVSIESTSGVSDELVRYLKSERMKDVFYVGAFDGDAAGERAYKRMNELVPMENEFDFDSGIDFADKMKKENT